MKKSELRAAMLLLSAGLPSLVSAADPYWVSQEGTQTDIAACQSPESAPLAGAACCKGSAVMNDAPAGSVVVFRGGDYYPGTDPCEAWTQANPANYWQVSYWMPGRDGSEGEEIVFKAWRDEVVNIRMRPQDCSSAMGVYGPKGHYVYDGLNFFQANTSNNGCSDGARPPFRLKRSGAGYPHHVTLRNGSMYGVGGLGLSNNAPIYLDGAETFVVENMNIDGGGQEGGSTNDSCVTYYNTRNSTIRYSSLHDCYQGIYDKNDNQAFTVDHVHIFDVVNCVHYLPKHAPERVDDVYKSIVCQASNNFFSAEDYSVNGSTLRLRVVNSTARAAAVFLNIDDSAGAGDNTDPGFYNNIGIVVPRIRGAYFKSPTGSIDGSALIDYNIYWGLTSANRWIYSDHEYGSLGQWVVGTSWDAHSVEQDPLLAENGDGDWQDVTDFRPSGGSPLDTIRDGYDGGYRGAWDPDRSMWIGHCPTDRFPDVVGSCDVCGNADESSCGCGDRDLDGFEDQVCGGDDCNDGDRDICPGCQERCDNDLDDDCDGAVNEGCSGCTTGDARGCPYGGPAVTEGVGVCRVGTQACVDGTWSECSGEVLPGSEEGEARCTDGLDNDCDGMVDDQDSDCSDESTPGSGCSGAGMPRGDAIMVLLACVALAVLRRRRGGLAEMGAARAAVDAVGRSRSLDRP
jgi:hypothetical protein